MSRKRCVRWKITVLVLVLSLVIPVLAACDDDDDEKAPTVPASNQTAVPITTVPDGLTETPANTDPIKIGAMTAWSGPAAIAGLMADEIIEVVNYQLEKRGGILGGRVARW